MAKSEMTAENLGTGVNWAKIAVRDAHGAIDTDATVLLVREELTAVASSEITLDEISGAVSKVFARLLDTPNGKSENGQLGLAELASRSVRELDAPFGQEAKLVERVKNYIRGESDLFKSTNGERGSFLITTGRTAGSTTGGVRLSTPKVVEDYRALQARKAVKAAANEVAE